MFSLTSISLFFKFLISSNTSLIGLFLNLCTNVYKYNLFNPLWLITIFPFLSFFPTGKTGLILGNFFFTRFHIFFLLPHLKSVQQFMVFMRNFQFLFISVLVFTQFEFLVPDQFLQILFSSSVRKAALTYCPTALSWTLNIYTFPQAATQNEYYT